MATIYNIVLTSYWCNYSENQMKLIVSNALAKGERLKGNSIKVEMVNDEIKELKSEIKISNEKNKRLKFYLGISLGFIITTFIFNLL